jgi:hypothetical protein
MEITSLQNIQEAIQNKIPLCLHFWRWHKKLWRKHFDLLTPSEQYSILHDNGTNLFVKEFHTFIFSQASKAFLDETLEMNQKYSFAIGKKTY